MTTKSQAVDQLAQLHNSYCPLLDELIAMAESEPISTPAPDFAWWSSVNLSTDTANPIILEEQRQAKLIWTLGKIAWGPAAGVQLKMMKASPSDLLEIADVLQRRRLDDAHRAALIGCCVRSQRLGDFLRRSDSFEPGHKGGNQIQYGDVAIVAKVRPILKTNGGNKAAAVRQAMHLFPELVLGSGTEESIAKRISRRL